MRINGNFSYSTPDENARIKAETAHYNQFCKERGYVNCYTINPSDPYKDRYLSRTGFKAKDGTVYKTAENFKEGTGWFPGLEKDGICYGCYQPYYEEGYIPPWDDQLAFLEGKGYKRIKFDLSEDYLENINLQREYYLDRSPPQVGERWHQIWSFGGPPTGGL